MSERSATGDWPDPGGSTVTERPTVPGYEVLEELGRGGMGVVYKARQLPLDRLVALKVLRDGALAGPAERTRFRREAEAAAAMRHPNIIRIYEVGEHQGRPFFSMELVDGGSLDQLLAGRPVEPTEAARLCRTLAEAVEHAHSRKIIHRDLKPANVLLHTGASPVHETASPVPLEPGGFRETRILPPLTGPGSPPVKITDFGLAKRLDHDGTALTQDGAVLGTPSYMAPEQAEGKTSQAAPTADVYALGAILYELLTGRPPFEAGSWNATVEQVLHVEPTPPGRVRADVPADLETVCLKCLEKEPGRRYASAWELADDLGRYLEGRPVTAVPLSPKERLARLAAHDGYQLLEEIGSGPRSTVYRVLHGPLQQPLALKVFTRDLATREDWKARLRAHAGQWGTLSHPNLVPVQEAGWWDGIPYVALEYAANGSLAGRLAGERQPVVAALRLVEQVADVVGYLHRQGVVHGNLKPANILLAAGGIPRLCDFRATGGLHIGPPPTDGDVGGLAYVAPELLRDPAAEPHPNADVYGLGLLLYELLTGRPPFAGESAREVLDQVRSHDPEPPSRLGAEVPAKLERVCLRCLLKNPWQRYSRVYDLVRRLR